jgi:two-component system phosphate regulon sensor histidine kinase PhoR
MAGAMIGLGVYLMGALESSWRSALESRMISEAHLAAEESAPFFTPSTDQPELNEFAVRYSGLLDERVTVIARDGTVLGESDAAATSMENHLTRPEVQEALKGRDGVEMRYSATLKMNYLYVSAPIRSDGQIVGVVRLAKPAALLDSSLGGIRTTIIISILIVAIAAFFLALIITNATIRPITELTRAARQIAGGDHTSTLLPVSDDELGQLNHAFNQMSAQIRTQIDELTGERAKLSSVLNQMMDGVMIIDQGGLVQLINPAAERMFHLQPEHAVGISLIEAARHHLIAELYQKCRETHEPQAAALDIKVDNLYLQVIATPLKFILPGSVLLLFQNLTRQRKLETVRQDFVSNVSHELRTPLASLKALTETLQEGALEDPPAAQRFLSHMETEIDTLTQMVQELLELSRIESGQVPLKRVAISPLDLVTPAAERIRLQAVRAGLTLDVDCPEDLHDVSADPERIEQVLINLLHNAVKFTQPGGKINILVKEEDAQTIFEIRDTGVGISDDDLPRVFERFYKADRARSGGGTGLGLSIARHIIEAHGGKIWVESTVGKGSSFFFSLPREINA